MSNFSIGIPTLNRADLLIPSVEKYIEDFPGVDIHIIDNGKQGLKFDSPNVFVYEQDNNLGVAGSWNELCSIIYNKKDWALLINDDVYLGYNTQTVEAVIESSQVGIVQSLLNFSVILLKVNTYVSVGGFDSKFYPAYYEDSDYLYRIKLLGFRQEVDTRLNPMDARVSQTYEKCPEYVNSAMRYNRQRYIDKWGDIPLMEKFTTPFNKYNDGTSESN
jgi:GT2 family glycosyltransferase